jgi:tRNA dimethylallyltransferase
MPPPRIAVVVGPTGAGKSQLALELARMVGAEIVSADSQQVYRGMDIGTGKVTPAERAAVPHHLIDVCDPDDEMTAARFLALADAAIADIAARGRPVVVVGGTMLYVRVLLVGLAAAPPGDPATRARLVEEGREAGGPTALHRRLLAVDPAAAARIHPGDERRLVRALEVLELSGETQTAHHERSDWRTLPLRYPVRMVGLAPAEREDLYRRIDARVAGMMAAGLLEEVAGLRARGIRPPLRSQQAIGYAELHRHLDGELEMAEAVRLIQRNSRHYARRQLSWYRGDERIDWHPSPALPAAALDELRFHLRPPVQST